MSALINQPITSQQLRRLAGPVSDHTILAILESGASAADVEIAIIHAHGEGDYSTTGRTLAGKAAQVFDILTKDDLYAHGDER